MTTSTSDIKIYDGVEVRAQKPLDIRSTVKYREDLYNLNTWPHDSYIDEDGNPQHIIYMKEGMVVCVTGDEFTPVFELYILTDLKKILNKDLSGWKFYGGSGGGTGLSNIDGGRSDERYAPGQKYDALSGLSTLVDGKWVGGGSTQRGETDKE